MIKIRFLGGREWASQALMPQEPQGWPGHQGGAAPFLGQGQGAFFALCPRSIGIRAGETTPHKPEEPEEHRRGGMGRGRFWRGLRSSARRVFQRQGERNARSPRFALAAAPSTTRPQGAEDGVWPSRWRGRGIED